MVIQKATDRTRDSSKSEISIYRFAVAVSRLLVKNLIFMTPLFSLHLNANEESKTFSTKAAEIEKQEELRKVKNNSFALISHRPSYILPISYTDTTKYTYGTSIEEYDHTEAKFQFSFRFLIADEILDKDLSLYFAYTHLSLWQAYNNSNSSPFRETNHEPEFLLDYTRENESIHLIRLALSHESNGQTVPRSRSWNRLYLELQYTIEDLWSSFQVWYRIPEDRKTSPSDTDGDDNPNIERYMGYFLSSHAIKWEKTTFSLAFYNNLRSNNKGAVEITASYPLNETIDYYLYYYNGYGESLIDYDRSSSRIGLGFVTANFL